MFWTPWVDLRIPHKNEVSLFRTWCITFFPPLPPVVDLLFPFRVAHWILACFCITCIFMRLKCFIVKSRTERCAIFKYYKILILVCESSSNLVPLCHFLHETEGFFLCWNLNWYRILNCVPSWCVLSVVCVRLHAELLVFRNYTRLALLASCIENKGGEVTGD